MRLRGGGHVQREVDTIGALFVTRLCGGFLAFHAYPGSNQRRITRAALAVLREQAYKHASRFTALYKLRLVGVLRDFCNVEMSPALAPVPALAVLRGALSTELYRHEDEADHHTQRSHCPQHGVDREFIVHRCAPFSGEYRSPTPRATVAS